MNEHGVEKIKNEKLLELRLKKATNAASINKEIELKSLQVN
jgi:hypothetical protein